MIKVKDILNLKVDGSKLIAFSIFQKEWIINHLEDVTYASSYYSNSEGLGLEEISKDKCDTLDSLKETIKYNRLADDEKLLFWDDELEMNSFDEIIEFKNIVLFI